MTDKQIKTPFIKIAYIKLNEYYTKTHLEYNFFLVLNGTIRVSKGTQTFFLEANDVFLFESGHTYSISGAGNNLILSIIMDHNFFSMGNSLYQGFFVCNSALDSSRDYIPLRQLLSQIAATYFGDSDINHLNLTSLAYSLLYYLNTYHYEKSSPEDELLPESKNKERMISILDYIQQNYSSPITLQQVADYLHLSSPYLSSFFKQNMNENFLGYVNKIRLKHAVDNLINTNLSITSIVYDNGFPSMSAFNKIFKETYHTTPNNYRNEKKKELNSLPDKTHESIVEVSSSEYSSLLQNFDSPLHSFIANIQFPSQQKIEIRDMKRAHTIIPIWKSLINIGPLAQLSKRDIEKQIAQLQNGAPFQYARVKNIIDANIIPECQNSRNLLFTSYDRAIDILLVHQLIPYLELSYPMEHLSKSEQGKVSIDIEHYIYSLHQLITHSINMYGAERVENWYFEINYYENEFAEVFEEADDFLHRFTKAYTLIKAFLPNAKVGGICHDTLYGYANFNKIIEGLISSQIHPDFLSIGIMPYEHIRKDNDKNSTDALFYTNDTSYALHKVEEFKTIIQAFYKVMPEIHVAYLAPDSFNYDYKNDTCFQSSFFFHNTVDLVDSVDMLGYLQLSDISSQPEESNDFLEGRNGLFNKYGIKKPGYHLLELFSSSPKQLVEKGKDYIILKGLQERYLIGLCNYTYISDYYKISKPNERLPITDAYKIYENPKTKNVSIKMNHLTSGIYDVKIHQINKGHGSPLDEWSRNDYWDCFSRDELEYMRKTLHPLTTHQSKNCIDGSMEFHIQLVPHEVLFIALNLRL